MKQHGLWVTPVPVAITAVRAGLKRLVLDTGRTSSVATADGPASPPRTARGKGVRAGPRALGQAGEQHALVAPRCWTTQLTCLFQRGTDTYSQTHIASHSQTHTASAACVVGNMQHRAACKVPTPPTALHYSEGTCVHQRTNVAFVVPLPLALLPARRTSPWPLRSSSTAWNLPGN